MALLHPRFCERVHDRYEAARDWARLAWQERFLLLREEGLA